jgi:sporulation protein YlmC with PRC-barrel domain
MLQLSTYLLNKPVLSLRTGGTIAWVTTPIFNPHRLNIEGFYVIDNAKRELILLYQDIRELSPQGFIVDDHDVLAQPEDLIRLKQILNLNFQLLDKPIITTNKEKIGKVGDYAVEVTTMYVQKLYAIQPFWKNFTSSGLSIDRTQIIEVTHRHIIINELLKGTPAPVPAVAV